MERAYYFLITPKFFIGGLYTYINFLVSSIYENYEILDSGD